MAIHMNRIRKMLILKQKDAQCDVKKRMHNEILHITLRYFTAGLVSFSN
jgi:hypothetical protein